MDLNKVYAYSMPSANATDVACIDDGKSETFGNLFVNCACGSSRIYERNSLVFREIGLSYSIP